MYCICVRVCANASVFVCVRDYVYMLVCVYVCVRILYVNVI
jgi:hypothetical protein